MLRVDNVMMRAKKTEILFLETGNMKAENCQQSTDFVCKREVEEHILLCNSRGTLVLEIAT